jgi:hypothetical protein
VWTPTAGLARAIVTVSWSDDLDSELPFGGDANLRLKIFGCIYWKWGWQIGAASRFLFDLSGNTFKLMISLAETQVPILR